MKCYGGPNCPRPAPKKEKNLGPSVERLPEKKNMRRYMAGTEGSGQKGRGVVGGKKKSRSGAEGGVSRGVSGTGQKWQSI